MELHDAAAFLRRQKYGVISSLRADGHPQSAVVGFGWNERAEAVFDALGETNKAVNLRRDARASVVVWEGTRTIQLEGLVDEPQGAERDAALRQYFEAHPDGPERLSWPGIAHFRFRPRWIRDSEFGVTPGPLIRIWVAPGT